MKLLHLADLHLGKKLNLISLEEDQKYILDEILRIAIEEKVDGVMVAGDVYDKAIPSVAAVKLLDDFLAKLKNLNLPVLMIAGNHDNGERLAFGHRLFAQQDIYLSPVYDGQIQWITLQDEYGPIHFHLLPFLKPSTVRNFTDGEINTYDDAIAFALTQVKANLKDDERHVLLAHQFITGGTTSESEELIVGGVDNIALSHFAGFDYVALGHLHRAQKVKEEWIRYGGAPLKYALSEYDQEKYVTVVELKAKGEVKIDKIPLKPLRDLRKIKGSYEELTFKGNYEHTNTEDFLGITLTDEQEIPDAINRLRAIYPNIISLSYDNQRTRSSKVVALGEVKQESPLTLFAQFYQMQNNQPLSPEQQAVVEEILDQEVEV